jgi:formate dehydrogenase major subunit
MDSPSTGLHRRDFLKTSAGGGFALGSLFGFGLDLQRAKADVGRSRIHGAKEVRSVCPYCAVGCGQLVHTRDGKIINVEGNPDSPINEGTLCPKGAAAYQLAVNPNRMTKVWYRAPGAKEWDKTKTLDWAMTEIAKRVKATRDAPGNFVETMEIADNNNQVRTKKVNHTLKIGSLGGATMDNEWNYVQCKLLRALGVVFIENQARI